MFSVLSISSSSPPFILHSWYISRSLCRSLWNYSLNESLKLQVDRQDFCFCLFFYYMFESICYGYLPIYRLYHSAIFSCGCHLVSQIKLQLLKTSLVAVFAIRCAVVCLSVCILNSGEKYKFRFFNFSQHVLCLDHLMIQT